MHCPNCAAEIPVDPGFVAWCDACGWNLQPTQPTAPPSLLGRAFTALGRRSGQDLFTTLANDPERHPGRSATTMLAFLGAAVVHGITLLAAVGGFLLIVGTWFTPIFFVFGTVLLGSAWVLRPRFAGVEEPFITRQQAPTLFTLIDRVSDAIGHPPVSALVLNHEFNAFYTRVGWRGQPVLGLGLPLLAILTPQQKVALIAHELAHGVNNDPFRSTIVGSAIAALQGWYDLLHPRVVWEPERGFMAYPFLLSNLLLLGLAQVAYGATLLLSMLAWRESQRAEYDADDLAAQIAGTEAKCALLSAFQYDDVVALAVQQLALQPTSEPLLTELQQVAAAMPPRERERLRRIGMQEDARIDATHPPTALRSTMLQQRPHAAARIILSAADDTAIQGELQRLEEPIRRRLIDAYRSHLYA